MAIVGCAIVGYCAIGKVLIATMPANITMMAITHAKIGRSMKKRAMKFLRQKLRQFFRGGGSARISRLWRTSGDIGHRLYLGAGANFLNTFHHDPISSLQT